MYLYSGKTPKYNNIPNDNLIIGQAANNGIKIDYNFAKYGTNDFFEYMPNFYFLKKYDVLLNTLGNGTIGRSGIFMDDKTNVLTDGHLFVMRNLYKETSFFLRHFLFLMRTEIEKSSTGTTNQIFLSMSTVGSYLIPLPPLSEQKRIVERIEQIEPLLQQYDKLEKQLTKLENEITDKLKKSILQYAIEGKLVKQDPNDEPASVLLERIKAEKEKLIKEGKIKRDKNESYIYQGDDKNYYDQLPINWSITSLKKFCEVYGGKRIPAGEKFELTPTTHKYIRVKDMKDQTVIDCTYISDRIFKIISKYTINYNDIYITVAGTIGTVGIVPDKYDGANLTENADKLILSPLINKQWFLLYLQSELSQRQFQDATTKVGQPKLAVKRIAKLIILLPPLSEQQRIVNKVERLFNVL